MSATAGKPTAPAYPAAGYPLDQGYTGYPQQPPYPQQSPYPGAYPQQGYPGEPTPPPPYPGPYPSAAPGAYPSQPYAPGYPAQSGYPPTYPAAPQTGFLGGGDPQAMYGGTANVEDPMSGAGAFGFSEKSIRLGFIRKVYSILMVQLAITAGFIAMFIYVESVKVYTRNNPGLWWAAFAITLVTIIAMACCENVRRKAPANFIFLFIFTLAESFMLGAASSYYRTEDVLLAVGITTAVCLALTLFAFQTKWDFTAMGGILVVCLVILLLFGIIAIFIRSKIVNLVYASLGALLFSVYLVYDTQMMMGGKHKYSISPEEYIFAALNLYLDIINIFMYILAIIGSSRD